MGSEIVLDTSAMVAMVSGEEGADQLLERTQSYTHKLVGAPSMLEAAMVLVGRKGLRVSDLTAFLSRIESEIVAFDSHHAEMAAQAFEQYGRARHPAGLNFGDCMSYAIAKRANAPILFTGNDFSRTDLISG